MDNYYQQPFVEPDWRQRQYGEARRVSAQRRYRSTGSKGSKIGVTAAAYLHQKTKRSWFAGPGGVYLSIPIGTSVLPALNELSTIPEASSVVHDVRQHKLFWPARDATRFVHRIHMSDPTIAKYCENYGSRLEHQYFNHSVGCDPWLAAHKRYGGSGFRY